MAASLQEDDAWASYVSFDDPVQVQKEETYVEEEDVSVRSFEIDLDPVRSSIIRKDIDPETRKWLAQQGGVDEAEVDQLRTANESEEDVWLDEVEKQAHAPPDALEQLESVLDRDDLAVESREYLEKIHAAGPSLLDSKKRVLHVYVCEPDSGRKIEIRVSVWSTVRDFREALWRACQDSAYTNCGNGYEMPERAKHWSNGPLVCGTATLDDPDATLSSFQVRDGSVVFPFGNRDWTTAAVDPDIIKDGAWQLGEQLLGFRPMLTLRHKNRGPGGISGNP